MSHLSAITRLPLCKPAFLQVVRDRKGSSNALSERVREGRSLRASKSSRGSSRCSHRYSPLDKKMLLTCTDPQPAQPTPHPNPTSSTTSTQPAHRPPTNTLAITDSSHHLALLSTRNLFRGQQCTTGAFALIGAQEGAENGCTQRAASVSREDRKPLNTVASKRVHTTTVSDLLANRRQTAVQSLPGMEQAGCWTRPGLLVWGGAPRRNRTGDPILTIRVAAHL
jgi:hypothetical protein